MDELYFYARSVNFWWAFILFVGMIYYGIMDIMFSRKCEHPGHVSIEHQYWAAATLGAVFTILFGTGEVLLTGVEGGIRVFVPVVFLVPTTIALKLGSRRVRLHKRAVVRGECK